MLDPSKNVFGRIDLAALCLFVLCKLAMRTMDFHMRLMSASTNFDLKAKQVN